MDTSAIAGRVAANADLREVYAKAAGVWETLNGNVSLLAGIVSNPALEIRVGDCKKILKDIESDLGLISRLKKLADKAK
jgi:hypothetical protein